MSEQTAERAESQGQLYEIRCLFCKRIHRSPFFDEIEDEILRCRDEAPHWQKGNLDEFEDRGIPPVSPETEARAGLDGGQACEWRQVGV